ncbi:hypothetical protein PhCBS80983_g00551 [Powellomyces hirtus]|uniref:Arsenate reductase (Glutaredoxin) n=1 Tax=Powellomyces hirtus TaxID=109895 RepID=A0A507EGE0_9FUNG|nr:hypothetical protein PhCBS80983_g00551 [Powellomyces hirtus]
MSSFASKPRFTIFHNPNCTKSCAGLGLLTSRLPPASFETVDYTTQPPSCSTLREIVEYLGENRKQAIREEAVSESTASGNCDEIVSILSKDVVKTLQRPIVVDWQNKKAVIGRPMSNVEDLISS